MSKLRVLIADDERLARMFLKNLLDGFADVEVAGEARDGAEALDLIKEIKPDLTFLDLQMPELSGLEVINLLSQDAVSRVVFVTADDACAVQMLEVNSINYLLKPVGREDLREVINQVKRHVNFQVGC